MTRTISHRHFSSHVPTPGRRSGELSRYRPRLDRLEDRLAPAVIAWDGGPMGKGTDWHDPVNWEGDVRPGAGDDAVIGQAFRAVTVTSAADVIVRSVQSAARLHVTGNRFTVSEASAIDNVFVLTGGQLGGAGTFTVTGLFSWSGGTIAGSGMKLARGGMGIANALVLEGHLTNAGHASLVTGGRLTICCGGSLTNTAGALFDASPDNWISGGAGGGTFVNQGTFRRAGGSGDLRLADNLTFINSGTLDFFSGALINSGTLLWLSGSSLPLGYEGRLVNAAGGVFEVRAPGEVWGRFPANAVVNQGVFRKTVESMRMRFYGTLAVSNSGRLDVQGGTLSVDFGATFTSTGTVASAAGAVIEFSDVTVNVSGAYNVAGTIRVDSGATVNFQTATTWQTVGPVTVTGGTVNFSSKDVVPLSTLWLGGTLTGDSIVTVSGLFTWVAGEQRGSGQTWANGRLELSDRGERRLNRTLVNTGTAYWNEGGFYLYREALLVNAAGGRFDLPPFVNGSLWGVDGGTFVNEGTLRHASSGTSRLWGSLTFVNTGTVEVLGGVLSLEVRFPNYADNTLTGGQYVLNGVLRFGNADVRTSEAVLTLGPAGSIQDHAGTNGLRNFAANGPTGILILENGRTFTASGPFRNDGLVFVSPGTTFRTPAAYVQTDGRTFLTGGVLAASLVDVQGGELDGTGTISGDVVNAGRLRVGGEGASGGLHITGNYTQTATGHLEMKLGGLIPETEYDVLSVDGHATLDGALDIALLKGYRPEVEDVFWFLHFNGSSGDFATFNGLDLGDGRALLPSLDEFGYYLWTYEV